MDAIFALVHWCLYSLVLNSKSSLIEKQAQKHPYIFVYNSLRSKLLHVIFYVDVYAFFLTD